jgi:hypothetical protein
VVPDATMAPVGRLDEARELMSYALSRRVSASTQMNDVSSRSHAICTFHIQTKTAMARINLIDLAGSERISKSQVTGDNQREASMINQSLTNLGIVIKALSEKKDFVPFRNSKLTFLLKDSLSGNSRTYMMANISPSESEVEETISTLRFASNVKRVVTDPHVNYGTHEDMINSLRGEIERLKQQLAVSTNPSSPMGAQLKMRSAVLKMIDASVSKKLEKKLSVSDSVSGPYLVNVSRDPMKCGLLAIILPDFDTGYSIGSLADQDKFVLREEGVVPSMAEVTKTSSGCLYIKLTNALGEIFVNSSALAINQTIELHANDIIQLGSCCKFRTVFPSQNIPPESPQKDSETGFLISNVLQQFPGISETAVADLNLTIDEVQRMIDETANDDFIHSIRLLLPSSVHQAPVPQSLIVIERRNRSEDGLYTYIDLQTFMNSKTSGKKTELVTLLETAKNRLDDLESKNKRLIEFSRKFRSNYFHFC